MKLIKDTTWKQVFENWRRSEAQNPGWIRCATKIKGWPNWESWRKYSASQINAEQHCWQIHEFTDPMNEIPAMLIGPYSSWQSRLPKKNIATFENLLNIPKQFKEFSKHNGIISIIDKLPFTTQFIGIIRDDINKIVCIEGHHRAIAITLAKKFGKELNFNNAKISIALTHLSKNEIYLLDQMLKRGSSKNPKIN